MSMSNSQTPQPALAARTKDAAAAGEEHLSVQDAGSHEGVWSSVFYGLRKLYIPSTPSTLIDAQKRIFSRFVKSENVSHKRFHLRNGEYINYIEIDNRGRTTGKHETVSSSATITSDKPPTTLLLTHGYGSGLGFFFANYDRFSSTFDRVIAVDWLGMAGSSRPDFPKTSWFSSVDPVSAVDFFVDSLQEFKTGLGVENYVLAGHSLGGYLSSRYAMKYAAPDLQGLLLLSPAGLAPHPPKEQQLSHAQIENTYVSILGRAWKANITPQSFLRLLGPWGPNQVHKLILRRFGSERWHEDDASLISNYLYQMSSLPASGEYALNAILKPIVVGNTNESQEVIGTSQGTGKSIAPRTSGQRPHIVARLPVEPQDLALLAPPAKQKEFGGTGEISVPDSNSSSSSSNNNNNNSDGKAKNADRKMVALSVNKKRSTSGSIRADGVPVLILYGDTDWIAFPGVKEYVNELRDEHGVDAHLGIIKNAGHHLYLDNVEDMHNCIDKWLLNSVRKEKGVAGAAAGK